MPVVADTTGDETAGPGLTNLDARAIPTRVLVLGLAHADGTILASHAGLDEA